jgi:hypothetical protein
LEISGGTHTLGRDQVIVLHGEARTEIVAARRAQVALERYAGVRWAIGAATSVAEGEGIVATIDHRIERREGYHLRRRAHGAGGAG